MKIFAILLRIILVPIFLILIIIPAIIIGILKFIWTGNSEFTIKLEKIKE